MEELEDTGCDVATRYKMAPDMLHGLLTIVN